MCDPHILLSINVNFSMYGSEMEMLSLIIVLRSMVLTCPVVEVGLRVWMLAINVQHG